MTTTSKTLKSFGLTCPSCGQNESLMLDLNNLTGEVQCFNCEDSYTVADAVKKVGKQLRQWQIVARWIAMAADAAELVEEELAG